MPASAHDARLRPATGSLLPNLAAVAALLFLSIGNRETEGASHDRAFAPAALKVADAGELSATFVSPHMEAPLAGGKNVLWCGTLQLAWNAACDLLGGDIQLRGAEPLAAALNKRALTAADLDASSYVALAGRLQEGILSRIKDELASRFKGAATPRLASLGGGAARPQDIVTYAYLFKNLSFETPFERLRPLVFNGETEVACFGFERGKAAAAKMRSQALIHDYRGPDDFVIEIKTKSSQDRLILAKTPPGATLAEIIAAVHKRAAGDAPLGADVGDTLIIPKAGFDVTRRYAELEGKPIVLGGRSSPSDLMLAGALQNIRFQMDEKGVVLRSEARMTLACGGPPSPRPTHVMIFDKPFLVMLQRRGSAAPYYAWWVANAQLLVRAQP